MSKIADNEEQNIVNMYLNKEKITKIAKIYNVSDTTIVRILDKFKIRENRRRKYFFNESFFKDIDNEHKAYWLGFIFGDGGITGLGNCLRLGLKNEDIPHLQKFIQNFDLNIIIKQTKKNLYYVDINSITLIKDLSKYGIVPNKTYLSKKLKLDLIPIDLQKHFLRGLLDADGWITAKKRKNKNTQFSFGYCSYHKGILEDIKNWFNQNHSFQSKINLRKNKKGQCYQWIVGGNQNFIKIFDLIYKDSNIYLDRKFLKIQRFLEHIASLN